MFDLGMKPLRPKPVTRIILPHLLFHKLPPLFRPGYGAAYCVISAVMPSASALRINVIQGHRENSRSVIIVGILYQKLVYNKTGEDANLPKKNNKCFSFRLLPCCCAVRHQPAGFHLVRSGNKMGSFPLLQNFFNLFFCVS